MKPESERRADRIASVVWIGLGIVVMVLSWNMDRLARMNINPLTIPGLVPGLLGLALVVFGAMLAWRSFGSAGEERTLDVFQEDVEVDRSGLGRIAGVALLCVVYAVLLLGRGIPYPVSTAVFVFALALLIEWFGTDEQGFRPLPALMRAALTAGLVTVFAVVVFERFLLLRLP